MKRGLSEQGFTLLEMLIVVAIFAVGAGLAMANLTDVMRNSSLKSDTDRIFNTINSVRMQAMKENRPMAICFDTANSEVITYRDNGGNGSWDCGGDDTEENRFSLSDGTSYSANGIGTKVSGPGSPEADGVDYANNRLVLTNQGMSDQNQLYVYLSNTNNRTYAVGTLITGAVRLQRWNDGAWEDSP